MALSVLSGHIRIMKMSWRVALKSACVMVQVESTLLHHMVHMLEYTPGGGGSGEGGAGDGGGEGCERGWGRG